MLSTIARDIRYSDGVCFALRYASLRSTNASRDNTTRRITFVTPPHPRAHSLIHKCYRKLTYRNTSGSVIYVLAEQINQRCVTYQRDRETDNECIAEKEYDMYGISIHLVQCKEIFIGSRS